MLEELCNAVIVFELAVIVIIGIIALNVLFRIEKKIDNKRQTEPVEQTDENRVIREPQVMKQKAETVKKVEGIVICRKCYAAFSANSNQCPKCGTARNGSKE